MSENISVWEALLHPWSQVRSNRSTDMDITDDSTVEKVASDSVEERAEKSKGKVGSLVL